MCGSLNRVPDELWMKVHDIVQETGIKTIPMEKKFKKAKWLSGEALQIAVKRREAKSKGEKERYKLLNAEFQRIARRDALNMPANLENSAVATGLEKVSFHSNLKERQRQRMLKLPHNCTHLTR